METAVVVINVPWPSKLIVTEKLCLLKKSITSWSINVPFVVIVKAGIALDGLQYRSLAALLP